MSQFDKSFAAMARPALMTHAGRAVTYQQKHADDVALTAMVGQAVTLLEDSPDGDRTATWTRPLQVSSDPKAVSGGVANPAIDDTVIIDGETWVVQSIEALTASLVLLSLVRTINHGTTAPGTYRS